MRPSLNVFGLLKFLVLRSRKLFMLSIMLWVFSITLGFLAGYMFDYMHVQSKQSISDSLSKVFSNTNLQQALSGTRSGNLPQGFLVIFLNNLSISFLMILLGFTIVLPFALVYSNGMILGLAYGISFSTGRLYFLQPGQWIAIAIFMSLEVLAYSVATTLGLRLAFSAYSPQAIHGKSMARISSVRKTFREFKNVLLLIPIFLAFAAVIETAVVGGIQTELGPGMGNYFDQCGVTFTKVISNSPAEKAGLEPFSTIVGIDSDSVRNTTEMTETMQKYRPNDMVSVELSTGRRFNVLLGRQPAGSNSTAGFIGIMKVSTQYVKKGDCGI